jgi:hypothetical protein
VPALTAILVAEIAIEPQLPRQPTGAGANGTRAIPQAAGQPALAPAPASLDSTRV